MRSLVGSLAVLLLGTISGVAAPLSGNAKQAIPYEIQQIIQVDYRVLNSSPTAIALKEKLMPEQLKSLETSLKRAGLNTDEDVDNLTFALFRMDKNSLGLIGIAQGNIPVQKLTLNMKKQKIKPQRYQDMSAVKRALDANAGDIRNVNYNATVTDQLGAVQSDPIWSILDGAGTQNMLRSALGEAAGMADYESIKKRLLGSSYTMEFGNGVKFNLDVKSSDSFTAATLSSLMRAGALYKRMSGAPEEKAAVESLSIDSSGPDLLLKFEADDNKFVSLLKSPMFQAISR
jgi:hypothetical protein